MPKECSFNQEFITRMLVTCYVCFEIRHKSKYNIICSWFFILTDIQENRWFIISEKYICVISWAFLWMLIYSGMSENNYIPWTIYIMLIFPPTEVVLYYVSIKHSIWLSA